MNGLQAQWRVCNGRGMYTQVIVSLRYLYTDRNGIPMYQALLFT